MDLADVGLMSMYIMDCHSLSEIAGILGRKNDVGEFDKEPHNILAGCRHCGMNQLVFSKQAYRYGYKVTGYRPPTLPNAGKSLYTATGRAYDQRALFNPGEFYGEYVLHQ